MKHWFAISTVLLIACAVSVPQALAAGRTNDPKELRRTWEKAFVYLPGEQIKNTDLIQLVGPNGAPVLSGVMGAMSSRGDFSKFPRGLKFPVVIYLHGCIGLTPHNEATALFLAAKAKFAVIQPRSFARKYRPSNCDPGTKSGGKFRKALAFRIAEANHAIREARKLAWVDSRNVFLMGHSEGGIATSKFKGERVNARIIEGATCHYGWPEWSGLTKPKREPVLALLGANDPWQRGKRWQGTSCGTLMSRRNGSRSVVIKEWPFANRHAVALDPNVQPIILEFLQRNKK